EPNGSRRRRREGDTGGKTETPTVTMERHIGEKKLGRGGEKKTLVERNLGVLDLPADANADPIIETVSQNLRCILRLQVGAVGSVVASSPKVWEMGGEAERRVNGQPEPQIRVELVGEIGTRD